MQLALRKDKLNVNIILKCSLFEILEQQKYGNKNYRETVSYNYPFTRNR